MPAGEPRPIVPKPKQPPKQLTVTDPEIKAIIDRINTKAQKAQGLVIHEDEMVEISVGELRKICEANPNHLSSAIIFNGIRFHTPNMKVTVEKVQIDAITQNRGVRVDVTHETGDDGQIVPVERKSLE